jgi:hypothetical protein
MYKFTPSMDSAYQQRDLVERGSMQLYITAHLGAARKDSGLLRIVPAGVAIRERIYHIKRNCSGRRTNLRQYYPFYAINVANELYISNQAANGIDHLGAPNKFRVPTIANGKVYVHKS